MWMVTPSSPEAEEPFMPNTNSRGSVNPRHAGGGADSAPLSKIRDNLRTTQDIATKLSVPYRTSILHLV